MAHPGVNPFDYAAAFYLAIPAPSIQMGGFVPEITDIVPGKVIQVCVQIKEFAACRSLEPAYPWVISRDDGNMGRGVIE